MGGWAYFDAHNQDASKYSLVMESDMGNFKPRGLMFDGTPAATEIMREIMSLLAPIDATLVVLYLHCICTCISAVVSDIETLLHLTQLNIN